jgi:hypothetical protein
MWPACKGGRIAEDREGNGKRDFVMQIVKKRAENCLDAANMNSR